MKTKREDSRGCLGAVARFVALTLATLLALEIVDGACSVWRAQ